MNAFSYLGSTSLIEYSFVKTAYFLCFSNVIFVPKYFNIDSSICLNSLIVSLCPNLAS